MGGGFGLPASVDRSFDRLINGLVTAFSNWSEQVAAPGRGA
jgi:hypothetical protein